MNRLLLLFIIAGLVCWLPGQALANGALDTYVSNLNVLKSDDPGFPESIDYCAVTVYRHSTATASVGTDLIDTKDNNFPAFLNMAGSASVLDSNASGFNAGASLKYLRNPGFNGSDSVPRGYVGDPPLSAVPLPGAILLIGAGLARMTAYVRRKWQV